MTDAPLAGWTVGVTADRRAEEQLLLLERRGARLLHGPVLRTVPIDLGDGVAAAIDDLVADPPDVVVLTTGIGTRAWFDAAEGMDRGEALRVALAGATVLARGPKAAGAALTAGLQVAWQAPGATGEELVAHLADAGVAGRRVAVQLDGRAVPVLGEAVRRLGASVVDVPVYRWTPPLDDGPALRLVAAACDGQLDALTFTAAPAIANLLALAEVVGRDDELLEAMRGPVATVSVGPVCSAAARAAGVDPAVEPTRPRLGAMIQALAEHAAAWNAAHAVAVGPVRVTLRAAAAVIDGRVVDLAPGERAVLAQLLERPGAVVAKDRLARRDSGGEPAGGGGRVDGHAVEGAVGRLRRKLDGLLDVRTVARRGYLLTPPPTT